MASSISSMSFEDMVQAAMQEERHRRQADRAALAKIAPLGRALLADSQASLSQTIIHNHSPQEGNQFKQTADQASNALDTSQEEHSQPSPPSPKISRQYNIAQLGDGPAGTRHPGNGQKRPDLGTTQAGKHQAAKRAKLAQDVTQSNHVARSVATTPAEPKVHATLFTHKPVSSAVVLKPVVSATVSEAEVSNITAPEGAAPKAVSPKARLSPKTAASRATESKAIPPTGKAHMLAATTTTSPSIAALKANRLNKSVSLVRSMRGVKPPKSEPLKAVTKPGSWPSQAIAPGHESHQDNQTAANIGQVQNASRGAQGAGQTQRPVPLTAQALSGIVVKRQKREVEGPSPSPFVGSTPQAGTATTDSSDSPGESQDTEDGDGTPVTSGRGPRKPRRKANPNPRYVSKSIVDMRGKSSEWYDNIDMKAKFPRGDKATLDYVKRLIRNCVDAARNNGDTERWFSELRNHIQSMESYRFLTPVLVKKSGVLDDEQGLPLIFAGPDKNIFPWDVALDAEALWGRWIVGDIDGFVLRGIVITKTVTDKGAKNTSYRLEENYPAKRSANIPGANELVNGQWWPLRICALRDGAHGASEAGIAGQAGIGAYSIVMGASKTHDYSDEDHGGTIQYCGTKSDNSNPTEGTILLDLSFATREPIRVLRGVNRASKYAPKEGVRYDGLYEIYAREVLDPAIAWTRYSLRRLDGQEPIRWSGVEARPSDRDMRVRMSIRKDLEW